MEQLCTTSREIVNTKYSIRRTAIEYLDHYSQI
jgi:hypothetical protein